MENTPNRTKPQAATINELMLYQASRGNWTWANFCDYYCHSPVRHNINQRIKMATAISLNYGSHPDH